MNYNNMQKSETTEQIGLFNWAKMNEQYIPELKLLHHIPNEGKRSKSGGAILKAAGLKPGIPDICLPVARQGYNALYIEMKYGNNKPTAEQREMISALRESGNKVSVCYSAEEAREVIRHYLQRAEGFDLVNCEEAVKQWYKCRGIPDDLYQITPCRHCIYYVDYRKSEKED